MPFTKSTLYRLPQRLMFSSLLALGACVTDPIGDEVGTYRVTMSLVSNSCGAAAVNLQDGHSYTAQLRVDGDQAYWRLPGQKPMGGTYDEGHFSFAYSSAVAKSAPDAGTFCQLMQDEVLEGAVALTQDDDAGIDGGATAKSASTDDDTDDSDDAIEAPESGLVGRHIFTIKAAAGTDCAAALAPEGAFDRLPCSVRYDLKGTDTKSF
ncbi:MAG: hypothetical protein QM778_05425 [Myxococcales bacterium]